MLILTIRTDKPEAELGLYNDDVQLAYHTWMAHRELAETIQKQIGKLLESKGKTLNDLGAVIVYQGPGSFTGLRIGISIANALAYGLNIPVVSEGVDWIETGVSRLISGDKDEVALPEYGSLPNVTEQRK